MNAYINKKYQNINISDDIELFISIFGECGAKRINDAYNVIEHVISILEYYYRDFITFIDLTHIILVQSQTPVYRFKNIIAISLNNEIILSIHRGIFKYVNSIIKTDEWGSFSTGIYNSNERPCYGFLSKYAMLSECNDKVEVYIELFTMHNRKKNGVIYDKVINKKMLYLANSIICHFNTIQIKNFIRLIFKKLNDFDYYRYLVESSEYIPPDLVLIDQSKNFDNYNVMKYNGQWIHIKKRYKRYIIGSLKWNSEYVPFYYFLKNNANIPLLISQDSFSDIYNETVIYKKLQNACFGNIDIYKCDKIQKSWNRIKI
jgi:hypothetical protein